jgi:methionine aminotransferase
MKIQSKLPNVGTSIFAVMSKMARDNNAINLAQGFPNFDCDERLKELAKQAISNGFNQYAPANGLPNLTEQIAIKTKNIYKKTLDENTEITVTSGATQAIFSTIQAFVKRGDKVIIIEPAYDSYRPTIELCGGEVIAYSLPLPNFKIDWEAFSELVTDEVKMIIVNTPHNPTGTIWTQNDWLELSKIVAGTNTIIVSDEVYEHIVFDGNSHESILKFPELWKRTIAISSFGKTFHTTGWKIGYVIAPENLTAEFRKVHQFTVFCVSTPMQWATAEFLKSPETYLDLNIFYQNKRDLFLEILTNSRFQPLTCEGTYFQLVDYSQISEKNDVDFAIEMTQQHSVAVIPITPFCKEQFDGKIVRLCFAKTDDILAKAGEILKRI